MCGVNNNVASHLPDEGQGEHLVSVPDVGAADPHQHEAELLAQLHRVVAVGEDLLVALRLPLGHLLPRLDSLLPVNNPGLDEVHQLGDKK